MNMRFSKFSLLAVLFLIAPMAHAMTLNLDFNEFDDVGAPTGGGAAGGPASPVSFINTNHGLYDAYLPSILLGDDGWDSRISFDANPGYLFSANSVRLVGGAPNIWTAPISGAVDTNDPTEQLAEAKRTGSLIRQASRYVDFIGYRDGAVVATQDETFGFEPPKTVEFNSSFVDLDKLVVSLDFGQAISDEPTIVGNMLYYCPNDRCGSLEFDDLLLNVSSNGTGPATVPIPSSILLLGSAIFGLIRLGRVPGNDLIKRAELGLGRKTRKSGGAV